MNIFEQYGIKEVADCTLYSIELDENDDENMEGYILGEIDKEFTRISREANPEYANRRIDLYKKWL